jgi:hypothetical protein
VLVTLCVEILSIMQGYVLQAMAPSGVAAVINELLIRPPQVA